MNGYKNNIILFLIIFSLFSCSDDSDEQVESGKGVVYGFIVDSHSNEPIQGANVRLYPGGKSVITGQDGRYEFVGLRTGNYIVQYSKQGYLSSVGAPIVSSNNITVQYDMSLDKGESCLDLFLGELDFGNSSSAKTFVVSNKGSKTIRWHLYSDYHSYLNFDITEGELDPSESVAVNVNLLRNGTSAEITAFPIYIQTGNEKLGAIATISQYNNGSLNSLLVGTWIVKESQFWQKDIDDITYNHYDSENGAWITFNSNYSYEVYERQFIYDVNITNGDNMFHYQYYTDSYSYDMANGILQLGEYGAVYSIANLSKDYLELHEILMKDQDKGSTMILKRK